MPSRPSSGRSSTSACGRSSWWIRSMPSVLGMESPVNKRARALFPVVKERQALVNQLQCLLRDLGLERCARPVESIAVRLAREASEAEPPSPQKPDQSTNAPLGEPQYVKP